MKVDFYFCETFPFVEDELDHAFVNVRVLDAVYVAQTAEKTLDEHESGLFERR